MTAKFKFRLYFDNGNDICIGYLTQNYVSLSALP